MQVFMQYIVVVFVLFVTVVYFVRKIRNYKEKLGDNSCVDCVLKENCGKVSGIDKMTDVCNKRIAK